MDFEGALRSRLLAAGPVTTLVGQRIYWEDRPQNSALPAIVLSTPVDIREQHMGGFQTVREVEVQADVLAVSKAQKVAVVNAVIAALEPEQTANGIRFQRLVRPDVVPLNERTETQFIYRDAIRLRLFFSPA